MSERPKRILCFDNYPEAKLALGNVTYPVVIKPYIWNVRMKRTIIMQMIMGKQPRCCMTHLSILEMGGWQ